MAMPETWTDNIEKNEQFNIASKLLEAQGYQTYVYNKSVCVAGSRRAGDKHFWSLREYLDFADATVKGAPKSTRADQSNKSHGASDSSRRDKSETDASHATAGDLFRALETELERVRALGRRAVKERDDWKARALAAEAAQGGESSVAVAPDVRYRELRNFIAREFHPDRGSASEIEKLFRAEVFKILWAKIGELDKK
ncbi:MAG: hypothetical protein K2X45_19015 [Phreatobacter sp.]|nr:hypothetical protein [Phreatobacter sp.]